MFHMRDKDVPVKQTMRSLKSIINQLKTLGLLPGSSVLIGKASEHRAFKICFFKTLPSNIKLLLILLSQKKRSTGPFPAVVS